MKVLVIEDDENIVEAISIAFQMRWPEASLISTSSGEKGVELVGSEAVDIVILDLGLPYMSGFDVLKEIRQISNVPVIILTVMADEPSIVKGLEMGADDYIVKPVGQLHLLARVKAHLRRQTAINDAILVCGPLRIEPSTAQAFCNDEEIYLTPTEYRILHCLMQQGGHLVSHDNLTKVVWGNHDYPGAIDAIKVYIRRLRQKIEVDPSKPKVIRTRAGIGHFITKDVKDETR